MMAEKMQAMLKKTDEPVWYQDTEDSPSEIGVDAKVWRTDYKGFSIKVYPCKLINKNREGWEYELWNEKRNIDWDSWTETSVGGDHASDAETAKKWAIRTVDEWKD